MEQVTIRETLIRLKADAEGELSAIAREFDGLTFLAAADINGVGLYTPLEGYAFLVVEVRGIGAAARKELRNRMLAQGWPESVLIIEKFNLSRE